jgi:hypothetical protein
VLADARAAGWGGAAWVPRAANFNPPPIKVAILDSGTATYYSGGIWGPPSYIPGGTLWAPHPPR